MLNACFCILSSGWRCGRYASRRDIGWRRRGAQVNARPASRVCDWRGDASRCAIGTRRACEPASSATRGGLRAESEMLVWDVAPRVGWRKAARARRLRSAPDVTRALAWRASEFSLVFSKRALECCSLYLIQLYLIWIFLSFNNIKS